MKLNFGVKTVAIWKYFIQLNTLFGGTATHPAEKDIVALQDLSGGENQKSKWVHTDTTSP